MSQAGALVTSPNASIPAGLRKRAYDEAAIKTATGGHAAGIMFVAPDGDVLMLRRSPKESNFGGHWALPGGGVDDGETPEQGAIREAREEMGVDADPAGLRDIDKVVTPNGKVFHTYVMPVPEKFVPKLNDEHTGYAWASLDMLPRPMHPAVDSMLKTRLGMADDMKPEDWSGLRDGFLKWTVEEEREPEHANDEMNRIIRETIARVAAEVPMALDRDSVREYRKDGQLVVKRARITKANVCPYRGSEIPGFKDLGLEPDRIYQLLRDPEELRKAAPTLNGVQLLQKHTPVKADDHKPSDTVGSLGTDAEFVEEDGENYLVNSLFVNAESAIKGIENEKKRELSAGYHYTPDMTAGNFRGTAFDGIMRNIVFNHVALVEDGRAGPDVVVGDSMENLTMTKHTRFAAATLAMTAAHIAPLLAMDSKVTLPKDLFTPLTTKNFGEHKAKLLAGVQTAITGKLRSGLAMDDGLKGLKGAIDAFEQISAGKGDDAAPDDMTMMDTVEPIEGEVQGKVFDNAPMAKFLRGKGMGEDDIKTVCDMLPKNMMAGDEEESDEDKAKKEAEEKAKKEKDGQAMDSAIKGAVTAAVTAERKNQQGIRAALSNVVPYVGEIPATMAFDSAAEVYRHALVMKGVDGAKTMHDDALLPVLQTMPKIGGKQTTIKEPSLAMDSSAIAKARELAPGLANISSSL